MKRREFIIAAAATPLLTQLNAFAKEESDAQGFVVLYIDVRCLPPTRAEAYIERLRDKFKESKADRPDGWTIIFFPTRDYESVVELYKVRPDAKVEQIQDYIACTNQPTYDFYLEEAQDHQETEEKLNDAQLEITNLKMFEMVELKRKLYQANQNIEHLCALTGKNVMEFVV